MAYQGSLGVGQQLTVENHGDRTLITLTSSSVGQQQSQSINLQTGSWISPPSLFRTSTGFVLAIQTAQNKYFVKLQEQGMTTLNTEPSLANADVMLLEKVADASPMEPIEPMSPMSPMKPMKPMKMGDMEMNMNPMEMRMGNMKMEMGKPLEIKSERRFCTQCGSPVQKSDRFCASCGHQL
ncbi:zinc ribbon domain-containing protein [Oscillatoria salina]|uniref:zinc ribbon domain-containing protein n=1 Tax=Oscillatoria salina TaxID=331517 RepID=UPI0013BBDF0C|nr:zinc ribbon domain-containing protein [Oscillatoria salina]MBZ8178636.1 zinc ribbon domain-containing protein [Oscillatoria salina IIICB1]MEC4895777.1 zinc ribbon domain-containing protein [Oscillatoria sp. PMC 1050.18]NET90826.1 zinc ribbon domain-containing protein [Kamptonema sp. SIO1D9]